MSNPKFMTLLDLLKREKENKRANNSLNSQNLPIDVNAIQKAADPPSPQPTSSTNSPALSNVHTLSQYRNKPKVDASGNPLPDDIIIESKDLPISMAIKLLIPISIAMLLVIMYVKFIKVEDYSIYRIHSNSLSTEDKPTQRGSGVESAIIETIKNVFFALLIVVVIVVMTFLLFLLYYYRFYKLLYGLFGLVMLVILVGMATLLFIEFLFRFNIPLDVITGSLLLWNYSVLALTSVFWMAPLLLQQTFLILMSSLLSLTLIKALTDIQILSLLIILVVWDLIAVLCPYGPLRLLMNTYQKRRQEDQRNGENQENPEKQDHHLPPGLLFSTMVWYLIMLDVIPKDKKEQNKEEDPDDYETTLIVRFEGPKLGLGDFVFYSVLVGKAAEFGDFNLILGCYVGVIVGLLLTLVFLVIYKQPLPALPISISLGLIIFVISYVCVTPFLDKMNFHLIYI